MTGAVLPTKNNLPPAVVLPERLVHRSGRVIPGQFAGLLGPRQDPWFIEASPFNAKTYGAYPKFEFHHERGSDAEWNRLSGTQSFSATRAGAGSVGSAT